MAKKNNKKGFIGIYISPKEISIAEISLKGAGKFQPEHLVKFSTDFPRKDGAQRPLAQNADFFKSEAAWVGKFKSAVGKISWGASDVVVTLSENFAIFRYFSMPAINRKFWSKSIPLESKKYIPISFDNAAMDYDGFLSDGGKKLSVLFGISQKETVEFITTLMKDVGFKLYSIEINAVSLERLFSYIDAKEHFRHGYVHAADDATHILFSASGKPVIHKVYENEGGMSERRRLDIKGAMQYVDRYTEGDGCNAIVLTGDYANILKDSVEKESSPLPIQTIDLEASCGTKDTSSAAMFAMGAALYGKFPSSLRMDISGISTTLRVNSEIQKIIYTIGGIVITILLLLILKGQAQLNSINSELSTYKTKTENSELNGSNSDEIRNQIDNMRSQSMSLAYVFQNNDFLAPKLSVFVDVIPKQLWLEKIEYTNPILFSRNGETIDGTNLKMMKLTGGTYLSGEPRSQVTEGFLRDLKSTEQEFKVYMPPSGNMSLSVSAASKSRNGRQQQENGGVSKFVIDCTEVIQ